MYERHHWLLLNNEILSTLREHRTFFETHLLPRPNSITEVQLVCPVQMLQFNTVGCWTAIWYITLSLKAVFELLPWFFVVEAMVGFRMDDTALRRTRLQNLDDSKPPEYGRLIISETLTRTSRVERASLSWALIPSCLLTTTISNHYGSCRSICWLTR